MTSLRSRIQFLALLAIAAFFLMGFGTSKPGAGMRKKIEGKTYKPITDGTTLEICMREVAKKAKKKKRGRTESRVKKKESRVKSQESRRDQYYELSRIDDLTSAP